MLAENLLGPAIPALAELMAVAGVDSWAGLERAVAAQYRDPTIREAHEQLLQAEQDWTALLAQLDLQIGAGAGAGVGLGLGDTLDLSTELWDARTEEPLSLDSLLAGQHYDTLHLVLLRFFG